MGEQHVPEQAPPEPAAVWHAVWSVDGVTYCGQRVEWIMPPVMSAQAWAAEQLMLVLAFGAPYPGGQELPPGTVRCAVYGPPGELVGPLLGAAERDYMGRAAGRA